LLSRERLAAAISRARAMSPAALGRAIKVST
jgi:hypothetical protein